MRAVRPSPVAECDFLPCRLVLLLRDDLLVVLLDLVPEDVAAETTEPRDDPLVVLPSRRDSWSNALMVCTREEQDSDIKDW